MTEDQERQKQEEIERAKKPTDSQLQITELLANGLNQRQVAEIKGLKEDTVRQQLLLMRKRLKVNTTEQAVALAAKHGWIRVDSYPRE